MDGLSIYGAITGTIGTVTGVGALIIGVLGYRRDSGSFRVRLARDRVSCRIDVVNSGRRVMRLNRTGLVLQNGSVFFALANQEELTEAQMTSVPIEEALIVNAERENNSRLLCAVAVDTLNRYYYSDLLGEKRRLLRRLRKTVESRPSPTHPPLRATSPTETETAEPQPDLWLLPVRSVPPPDATEVPKQYSISRGPPQPPIMEHLFVVNRGDTTFEGNGRVELWVPTGLLDNALEHAGDWLDQRFSEEIDGVQCRLFHREFSGPVYPKKSVDLPPFRFAQVSLGTYNLYFQVVTSARTYPRVDERMRLAIEFATYGAIRGKGEMDARNGLPTVPRSTLNFDAIRQRVRAEFTSVDPDWEKPRGQPISVGFMLMHVPGTDKVNYVVSNGGDKQAAFEAAMVRALGAHAGTRIR